MQRRIVILGTGGTIAGVAPQHADHVGYVAGQRPVADLLARLAPPKGFAFDVEQVAQLDSKDIEHQTWVLLAQRIATYLAQVDVAAVLVTHGTDTLEETAWFLQCALQPLKPVVLTCAMRPATALAPDGPQNILDAVTVAAHADASGVLAVCAGVVHGAREVRKTHTYRLDAFGSGDAGPLAYVEQGQVRSLRPWPSAQPALDACLGQEASVWPRVELVTSHAGATERLIDLLVADGVHGLVIAATGNGTLHERIEVALQRATRAGVRIVRATRCLDGRVVSGAATGWPHADDLVPVKARVSLMLELAAA